MRSIDADAFEQDLKEKLLPLLVEKYGKEEAMNGLHFSLQDCISNIQSQPTITQPEPEWIPCSERLPIGSDIVLLSLPPSIDMNGDELVGGVICGHYISGKNENWGISDGSTFGYGLVSVKYGTNPTHWMPLPEPYRGEQE